MMMFANIIQFCIIASIFTLSCAYHHHHQYQYNRQYHLLDARNDYDSSTSSLSSLSVLSTASNFIAKNVVSATNNVLTSSIVKNITSTIANTINKNKNNTNDNYDYDDDDDEGQWKGKLITNDDDNNRNTIATNTYTNTNGSINRGLWRGKGALKNATIDNTNISTNSDKDIVITNNNLIKNDDDNNNNNNNNKDGGGIGKGILNLFRYPRKLITNVFKRDSNSIKRVVAPDNNGNNEPKGIVNIIGRAARRRLLNLFDRQTTWNKVVNREDDVDGSKYISMPQLGNLKSTIGNNYNNYDNTNMNQDNSILFKLRSGLTSGLAFVGSPITNAFKKDTSNSYSYYDQKNVRMLPSSQLRISDIKRAENKGIVSRIVGLIRKDDKSDNADVNYNNDAIATILSTTPKTEGIEIIQNDRNLLNNLQGIASRLMPFQRNNDNKNDNSVVSFSITKSQYNAPGPIEEIKITSSEAVATPSILQNVGAFGRNTFSGVRSLLLPRSPRIVDEKIPIVSPSPSPDMISNIPNNILISNELSQQLTTSYEPKEKFIKRADEKETEVIIEKKTKVTAILRAAFPFLSKNVKRVLKTGAAIKDLKKILNSTVDIVDVGDLSTTTYFNKNGEIVDQNTFTLETNAYNSSFLDYPRKVLSTIYDSWNLDAIGTYSDWAKQALFARTSAKKSIVDDISSFKEAETAPIEIITDVEAPVQKPNYAPVTQNTMRIADVNDNEKYIKYERPLDLKTVAAIDRPLPRPTKNDFAYLAYRRILIAVSSSKFVSSEKDADVFLREIGLKSLLIAVTQSPPQQSPDLRLQALQGLNNLLQQERKIALDIAKEPGLITSLCDVIELPFNMFRLRSQADKDRDIKEQYEAISLLFRMVRISESVADFLKEDPRLRKIMIQMASQTDDSQLLSKKNLILQPGAGSFPPPIEISSSSMKESSSIFGFGQKERKKSSNSTTILDYKGIKPYQMCKVIVGAIGASQWKPKQTGQRGLRILSFDGGGTRGVLSVAIMRELCNRVGKNPHEIFDIICGTSTGGIVAVLMGAKKLSVAETESLYDVFIDKVFGQKSTVKLVTNQASYDELEFENILTNQLGDEQFIDSVRQDCAKVFCVSTKVNTIPTTHIWRNYNYPPGQFSRYKGSSVVNTMTAVRATTAAPTFFVPVQFEGGLYCDGALVANNPTAIALQEAKQLFPGIPIETVVSIGTGVFSQTADKISSMGWDLLISQVIAGAVDTEDIHELLTTLLPEDQYFRFNPKLLDNLSIDEKDKGRLSSLKNLALDLFDPTSTSADAKRMEKLVNRLKNK